MTKSRNNNEEDEYYRRKEGGGVGERGQGESSSSDRDHGRGGTYNSTSYNKTDKRNEGGTNNSNSKKLVKIKLWDQIKLKGPIQLIIGHQDQD